MKKEHLGAFIDAVYAIAITMLALEIPAELKANDTETIRHLIGVFTQYSLSFAMLFGFWLQHRLVNELLPSVTRSSIWLSAAILLFVSLIPRTTTLAFEYGGQPGTIFQMNLAEAVDVLFVFTVLVSDLLLGQLVLKLRLPNSSDHPDHSQILRLKRKKIIITGAIVLIAVAVLLIPGADDNILWLVALLLFLQDDIDIMIEQLFKHKASKATIKHQAMTKNKMEQDFQREKDS